MIERKTTKFITYFVAYLILFPLGAIVGNASALALSLVLTFYLFLNRLLYPSRGGNLIIARRTFPAQIFEGEVADLITTFSNKGKGSIFLDAQEIIPQQLSLVQGSSKYALSLNPNQETRITKKIRAEAYGRLSIPPMTYQVRDPIGMWSGDMSEGEETLIQIYPRIYSAKSLVSKIPGESQLQGAFTSQKIGTGSDFHSIREYSSHDSIARINWKASARMQKLYSNEYILEKLPTVYLILDSSSEEPRLLSECVTIASSIAFEYLRRRVRVGLITLGNNPVHIRASSGKEQFYRLLECFTSQRAGKGRDYDSVAESIFDKRSSSRFILVSSLSTDRARPLLERLAFLSKSLTVVSVPFDSKDIESGDLRSLSDQMAHFQIKNNQTRLHDLGAQLLDWQTYDEITPQEIVLKVG